MLDLPTANWRKSSFSDAAGNCVELAALADDTIAVRNSRQPGIGALLFTRVDGA